MSLPTFLIIGAAKSGTTALYHHLKKHPQVFMSPVKEPNFFAVEGDDLADLRVEDQAWHKEVSTFTLDDYQALFAEKGDAIAAGEASNLYLYKTRAAKRIKRHVPDIKLVVVLRNPVERAWSHFGHLTRDNAEPILDFKKAVLAEYNRINEGWGWNWHYTSVGQYAEQLKVYFDVFGKENIKIYLYDTFNADPNSVMTDLYEFIGVDPNFKVNTAERHNVSKQENRNPTLMYRLMTQPNPIKKFLNFLFPKKFRNKLKQAIFRDRSKQKAGMPADAKEYLAGFFKDEILELQALIGQDLSGWIRRNGQ